MSHMTPLTDEGNDTDHSYSVLWFRCVSHSLISNRLWLNILMLGTLTYKHTHSLTCTAHRKSKRSLRSSCLEWRARALTKSNRDRMGS